MHTLKLLVLSIFLSQPCLAGDAGHKYKIDNKYLEVFGYKLATNHLLPTTQLSGEGQEHYVKFLDSPNSKYVIVLSYLHLQGKYDAWLYDKNKKTKPTHIDATHNGRHPEIKWFSNKLFSIAWAGMGYYTSKIYHVSNVHNGTIINEPMVIDTKCNLYITTVDDPLKTGIVIGKLFTEEKETFYFSLPESTSVMDRYESIKKVQILDNKINFQYIKNGKVNEYQFYPKLLKNHSNK